MKIESVIRQTVLMIATLPLLPVSGAGQTERSDSSSIDCARLGVVAGVTTGAFVVGHVMLNDLWWKGERSDFHVDWDHDRLYALGADKAGHAYFPYAAATLYSQALEWTGIDSTAAVWGGSGVALAYQTYIEVRDGFSRDWGFSWGDMGANIVGSALPVIRHYVPEARIVSPKISFYPSTKFRNGGFGAIIDDYESTFHWLSIDLHELLPEGLREIYPPYINIAIGHSVRDLDGRGGGKHEIYLSLDLDPRKLPGDSPILRFLKRNLNLYHLPAPAVRITPEVVWYGIHF